MSFDHRALAGGWLIHHRGPKQCRSAGNPPQCARACMQQNGARGPPPGDRTFPSGASPLSTRRLEERCAIPVPELAAGAGDGAVVPLSGKGEPDTPVDAAVERRQEFPEVISLNVGGTHFTTCLSTLRRFEDTMLSAMFSGRHSLPLDAEGRFFIDRDGAYFGDILNFLRSGELPHRDRVLPVYREAQYYAIGPLLDSLEDIQPLTGEKVRQAFLGLLPYYKENLKRIMEIAKLRAMHRKARFAKLKICVYKEDAPVTPYERPLFSALHLDRSEGEAKLFKHQCEVDVSFGPWEGVADVYDLLHCIVSDLAECGVAAEQQCIGVCDKHLISHYYCKRPIYEFKITWW